MNYAALALGSLIASMILFIVGLFAWNTRWWGAAFVALMIACVLVAIAAFRR